MAELTLPEYPSNWPDRGLISQVVPFTYIDGQTYQSILFTLVKYVKEELVPSITEALDSTVEYVDLALVAALAEVAARIDASEASTDQKIADLTAYVNAQVQQIIDDSIEVQDPVIKGIMLDPMSETRQAMDEIFAGKADTQAKIDAINEILNGRLSTETLDAAYTAKAITDNGGRLGADTLDERFAGKANQSQVDDIQETIDTGRLSEAAINAKLGDSTLRAMQVDRGASDIPLDSRLVRLRDGVMNKASINTRMAILGDSHAVGGYTTWLEQGMFQRLAYRSGMKGPWKGLNDIALPIPSGVMWYNGAVGGFSSANYLPAADVSKIATLNPHYVFHMVGSNDWSNAVPLETYKTNLRAAIGTIEGVAPGATHVLIHGQGRRDVSPAIPWADYGTAMKEVADEAPADRVYIDVASVFDILAISSDNYAGLELPDNTHMGNVGHRLMADFLSAPLGIPTEKKFAYNEVIRPAVPASKTYTANEDIFSTTIKAANYPRIVRVTGELYVTSANTNAEVYPTLRKAAGGIFGDQPIRINTTVGGSLPVNTVLYLPPSQGDATFVIAVQPAGGSINILGNSYTRIDLEIIPV